MPKACERQRWDTPGQRWRASPLLKYWATGSFVIAASALSLQAQSLNDFDDWVLGCDNLRQCVAIGMEPEGNASGVYLRVLRSGEGAAAPEVKVTVYWRGRWPNRLRLGFDDPALPALAELAASPTKGLDAIEARLPPEAVRSFLDALGKAKTLSVSTVQGSEASQPVVISLSGATAALTAMDEQQKRIGTTTALISPGREPAAGVPPPPALPMVRASKPTKRAPPASMPKPVAAAVERADCDEPPETRPIRAWLDERTLLWGVLCTKGVYRQTYAFFVHRSGAPTARPMKFQMPGLLQSDEQDNLLTGPTFDRRRMILDFHDLGRSMGDCGTAGQFVWDGHTFQPVELRSMPLCRGVLLDAWAVTWRAGVR